MLEMTERRLANYFMFTFLPDGTRNRVSRNELNQWGVQEFANFLCKYYPELHITKINEIAVQAHEFTHLKG